MKKRLFRILLAATVTASVLVGCGGGETKTNTPAGGAAPPAEGGQTAAPAENLAASGDKIVINYWTEDRHDMGYFEEKIKEFNEMNDQNIEIVLTTITEDYPNMLAMSYSSGNAPDIAGIAGATTGFSLKTFAEAEIIAPVNDYIKDEEFEKVTEASTQIVEGMNAIDGNVYWIPTAVRSGSRIIYNKSILDEAGVTEYPKTVQELVDLSKLITEKGAGQFYGMGVTSSSPLVRWMEGSAEMSGIYRYDYENGKFNFDGYKDIITTANQLFTDNSIFPGSATQGVDAMRAQFTEGTFGIWANASQEAGVFTDQFPITKFGWVVEELPTMDGEVKGTLNLMTQKGYLLFSSCPNKDAAWEVIKFFSSEDFLKGYLEGGYALPVSSYMTERVDSTRTGRLADFALKNYEGVYPSIPAITVEGDDYKAVLWSAAKGEIGVDEAIADLNTRYNQALDTDVSMGKVKRVIIKNFDPLHPNDGTVEYLDK